MSITSVDTDYDNLSITLIADFEAAIAQVWELWSDPRKLERWWGPPNYPATIEKHDLSPGGEVTYMMTGPDGDTHHGVWRVTAVGSPTSLEFADVFANADGTPITDMPVNRVSVRLTEREVRLPRGPGEVVEHGHARGAATGHRSDGRSAPGVTISR